MVEIVYPENKKRLENISLSTRIEDIERDLISAVWYSLALDDGADVTDTDTAHLLIFILRYNQETTFDEVYKRHYNRNLESKLKILSIC